MKTDATIKVVLVAGAVAAALYFATKITGVVSNATNSIATGAANVWVSLTGSGPVNVLGNVTLPDGTVVPISSLTWKTDTQGNSYTYLNGSVYMLAARNAAGNFTLALTATP